MAADDLTAPRAGAQEPVTVAPAWFDVLVIASVSVVAAVGAIGLLLAINGRYNTWLVLGLSLPVAAAMVLAARRNMPAGVTDRAAQIGAAAALALALAYMVAAGVSPSQNMVVTRDPGSYQNTARWLAREGSLEVDARGEAFADLPGLRFSAAAVYDDGPIEDGIPETIDDSGQLEFQFNHLAQVVMAAAYDIGGSGLLFRLPAIAVGIGLLALYAVTVRVIGRPILALFAPLLLTAGLPLLNVARNTYSEPFALLLLWGAILVLLDAHDRGRAWTGAVGGVMLGALVCARVDALVYVALMFPLATASIGFADTAKIRVARLRSWGATIVAALVVGSIGIVDLVARTGNYARDLGQDLILLRKGVVASAVVSVLALIVWLLVPQLRRLAERVKRPAAALAAVGIAAGLLVAWLLRPRMQTALTGTPLSTVAVIQKADGLPLIPGRTYAEDSLRWMAWYLGTPALLAAIGGYAIAAWHALRGKGNAALITVLLVGLGAGGVYWWDPSITPDQLWASRRYIPAILPALAIAATVALAAVPRIERIPVRTQHGVLAVVAGLLLVQPAVRTEALREQHAQAGFLRPVLDVCQAVPDDAAIVIVGGFASITLPQTLRSWCGVPVASAGTALTPETLSDVAAQVKAKGYKLFLVSTDANGLQPYESAGGPRSTATSSAVARYNVRSTLESYPNRYEEPGAVLPVASPFRLYVLDASQP